MAKPIRILDISQYEEFDDIGEGQASDIIKARDKKTGQILAAKSYLHDLNDYFCEFTVQLFKELNIMSELNHPSIIKLRGFSPLNFDEENRPIIFMDYISNGSLSDIVKQERKSANWTETKKLINIYGIASAMSYLHSHHIVHLDLKPGNILEDENFHPKIIDFGISRKLKGERERIKKMVVGTPLYIAPEMTVHNEITFSNDVYSFSMIVYQIVIGQIKTFKKNESTLLMLHEIGEGVRPEMADETPACYRELIERCWDADGQKRPTFDQIVLQLRNDERFVSEKVDREEFRAYVESIDKYVREEHSEEDDVSDGEVSIEKVDDLKSEKKNDNVKILSKLNHPCIQFLFGHGEVKSPNMTLFDLLNNERRGNRNLNWSTTQKLIVIYGIASAMSFLHSHDVLHCNLRPVNVLLDTDLFPRLRGMLLQPDLDSLSVYSAPETIESHMYVKASDVYSFAVVAYEVFTGDVPFRNENDMKKLFEKITENYYRPRFRKRIYPIFFRLVALCWSQYKEDRPTFDQIVSELRNNKEFITSEVNEAQYIQYIEKVDKYFQSEPNKKMK